MNQINSLIMSECNYQVKVYDLNEWMNLEEDKPNGRITLIQIFGPSFIKRYLHDHLQIERHALE